MAKIFDIDFRKGTLIDSVSNTAGTLTAGNGGFRRTEKGTALYCDGTTTQVDITNKQSLSLADKWTVIIPIKFDNLNDGYHILADSTAGSNSRLFYRNVTTYLEFICVGATTGATTYTPRIKQWEYVVLKSNGAGTITVIINNEHTYVNSGLGISDTFVINTIGGTRGASSSYGRMNGYISGVQVYDTELSTPELGNLYQEFLNTSPTEKEIRGFEYPKPTDLSYEDGLVAAYSFSPETVSNGTLIDVSGNGNNGTINGALLTKEGMNFDGVDDYVDITNNLITGQQYTACARFKILGGAGTRRFIQESGGSFTISQAIETDNKIQIWAEKTTSFATIDSDIQPVVGEWYDIISVYNNGNLSLYVNGVFIDSNSSGSGELAITNGHHIGTYRNNAGRWFNGEISDVRIYNYAFTADQAKDYHNSFVKPVLIEDFSNNAVGDTL